MGATEAGAGSGVKDGVTGATVGAGGTGGATGMGVTAAWLSSLSIKLVSGSPLASGRSIGCMIRSAKPAGRAVENGAVGCGRPLAGVAAGVAVGCGAGAAGAACAGCCGTAVGAPRGTVLPKGFCTVPGVGISANTS